jgi:hypothetical protein
MLTQELNELNHIQTCQMNSASELCFEYISNNHMLHCMCRVSWSLRLDLTLVESIKLPQPYGGARSLTQSEN